MKRILPEPSSGKGAARREPDVQTVVPFPGLGVKKPQAVKDFERVRR